MNKISMVVLKVVLKILEVAHWIGSISMIVLFVLSLLGNAGIQNIVELSGVEGDTMLNTYGFEVSFVDNLGSLSFNAIALFAIGAVLILSLMAMVFRNAYLIIKKSKNRLSTPIHE